MHISLFHPIIGIKSYTHLSESLFKLAFDALPSEKLSLFTKLGTTLDSAHELIWAKLFRSWTSMG